MIITQRRHHQIIRKSLLSFSVKPKGYLWNSRGNKEGCVGCPIHQKMVFKIPYEPPTSISFFFFLIYLITTSLPPQFLSSLPLGLEFIVGYFFCFHPFLSISTKISTCLRLLLQFLLSWIIIYKFLFHGTSFAFAFPSSDFLILPFPFS